jgi:hypothetical protein
MKKEIFSRIIMIFIGLLKGSQLACGTSTLDLATIAPKGTAVPPTPTPKPTEYHHILETNLVQEIPK